MNEQSIRALLQRVADGEESVDNALSALRALPFEELDAATVDHHRSLRWGFPEVLYCEGKTPAQVAEIVESLAEHTQQLLGTRATGQQFQEARKRVPELRYNEQARALWFDREPNRDRSAGVVVMAAGTSDLPVAEEAVLTLRLMGHEPRCIYDVGVAGLHRLLPHVPTLQGARVIVVVAGMEGALPSVVGGLVSAPVIAVPTSVGYGASFNGLAPLLTMLNSCATGVAVVNIDNGFGGGYIAAIINKQGEINAAVS